MNIFGWRIIPMFLFVLLIAWKIIWPNKEEFIPKLEPQHWISEAREKSWQKIGKIIVVGSAGAVASLAIILLIQSIVVSSTGTPTAGEGNSTSQMISFSRYIFLFVAVVFPIFEEWYFRGVLYDHLKGKWHRFGSILFVAGLFGLFHFFNVAYNWTVIPHAFAAGVIYCLIYDSVGMSGAVVAHSGNNFLAWVIAFILF